MVAEWGCRATMSGNLCSVYHTADFFLIPSVYDPPCVAELSRKLPHCGLGVQPPCRCTRSDTSPLHYGVCVSDPVHRRGGWAPKTCGSYQGSEAPRSGSCTEGTRNCSMTHATDNCPPWWMDPLPNHHVDIRRSTCNMEVFL